MLQTHSSEESQDHFLPFWIQTTKKKAIKIVIYKETAKPALCYYWCSLIAQIFHTYLPGKYFNCSWRQDDLYNIWSRVSIWTMEGMGLHSFRLGFRYAWRCLCDSLTKGPFVRDWEAPRARINTERRRRYTRTGPWQGALLLCRAEMPVIWT